MPDAIFQPTISPKQKQFQKEINELCNRYQYTFESVLLVDQDGINPVLKIIERLPKKEKDLKKVNKKLEKG